MTNALLLKASAIVGIAIVGSGVASLVKIIDDCVKERDMRADTVQEPIAEEDYVSYVDLAQPDAIKSADARMIWTVLEDYTEENFHTEAHQAAKEFALKLASFDDPKECEMVIESFGYDITELCIQ